MKNKTTAGILAILLGGLGIHQFYLNRSGKGILYLLFCWTAIPAIIGLIDGIVLLLMTDDDFNRKYNSTFNREPIVNNIHVNAHSGNGNNNSHSTADELLKLNELKDKGVISETEFNQQKSKILA